MIAPRLSSKNHSFGRLRHPAPHITTGTKHALFEHRRTLRRQQLTQQHIWNVIGPVDELTLREEVAQLQLCFSTQ